MKKLLLADGNSMLFRAYYATAYGRPMTTAQGLPTNAVFGFVQMIQKAIETVEPDSVLIAFDAGKHTFRHDLYPEYKGGRKPAPDDLVPQFQMVRDCLDAFGIRWVEMADIEADDLIGTVSKKNPDFSTYILSSDHDLLQLIDDTTSVLLMKKGISEMDVMTPAVLKEQMGIEPLQIIDMKGLMGDKSDNIPGIPGIGEKTALKLLGEYGTVEEVIAHEDELKGALYKKVSSSHESALLSKKLATIRRDVDVTIDADDLVFRPDYKSLVQFLLSLDMRQLASRFEEIGNAYETGEPETKEEVKEERMRVSRVPEKMLQKDFALFVDDLPTQECTRILITDVACGDITSNILRGVIHRLRSESGAEVREFALLIERNGFAFFKIPDQLYLVGLFHLFHQSDGLFSGKFKTLDGQVFLDDLPHFLFDLRQIVCGNGGSEIDVIVKAVRDAGADGQFRIGEKALYGLGHHVGRGMAQGGKTALCI